MDSLYVKTADGLQKVEIESTGGGGDYLPLSGGMLSGDVSLGGHHIKDANYCYANWYAINADIKSDVAANEFLVKRGNWIYSRTGEQLLSDIGAARSVNVYSKAEVDEKLKANGGSVSHKVFTSSNRSTVLTAGTAFGVPTYTNGDNSLSVFLNGLLCSNGVEYTEVSTTSISFTSDIPTDFEITAVVISDSGAGTRTVQTDESRDAVLTAGATYAVPSHTVGENRIKVYLGGFLADDWEETSATTIVFSFDIPAVMPIVVIADT